MNNETTKMYICIQDVYRRNFKNHLPVKNVVGGAIKSMQGASFYWQMIDCRGLSSFWMTVNSVKSYRAEFPHWQCNTFASGNNK